MSAKRSCCHWIVTRPEMEPAHVFRQDIAQPVLIGSLEPPQSPQGLGEANKGDRLLDAL